MSDSQIHILEPVTDDGASLRIRNRQEIGPYVVENCRTKGDGYQIWRAHRALAGVRPLDLFLLEPKVSSNDRLREEFLRKAKSVAIIRHPHLLRVYGAQVVAGLSFAVLERDEYLPLRDVLDERGLLWEEAVSATLGIISATSELHANGHVHGAIGVEALRIDPDGEIRLGGLGPSWIGPSPLEWTDDVLAIARLSWALLAGYSSVPQKLGPPPDARLLLAPEVWSELSQILESPNKPDGLRELSHWLELSLLDLADDVDHSKLSAGLQPEGQSAPADDRPAVKLGTILEPRPVSPTAIQWGTAPSNSRPVMNQSHHEGLLASFGARTSADGGPSSVHKQRIRLPKDEEIIDAIRAIPTQKHSPSLVDSEETRSSGDTIDPPDGELRRIAKHSRGSEPCPEVAIPSKETSSYLPWYRWSRSRLLVALVVGGGAVLLLMILLVR